MIRASKLVVATFQSQFYVSHFERARQCSYLYNVTLNVEDPTDADVGEYMCRVETSLGVKQAFTQLVIYGAPSYTTSGYCGRCEL